MFVTGLLLAAMSLFLCTGKALDMREGFLGVVAGSTIAGGAIIAGALMSRRFVPLAAVIMGGFVGALAGWSYYRLGGGTSIMEWMLALCIAPIGMWLVWLGGASGNRVVVGTALGGAVAAMLAALAFPILFNMEGPPIDKNFWALVGLLVGGILGSLLGAFIGWSGNGRDR
jgi:hypothetical protein